MLKRSALQLGCHEFTFFSKLSFLLPQGRVVLAATDLDCWYKDFDATWAELKKCLFPIPIPNILLLNNAQHPCAIRSQIMAGPIQERNQGEFAELAFLSWRLEIDKAVSDLFSNDFLFSQMRQCTLEGLMRR